ncbi:hypothetical protein EZV62_011388 [Acer yangbiense]|uniref:Pentacotripeptide-repeat region of PRORP domain-containing protein n=1 Tax=Acer yangbiense TaxID=1000413 RepID=A0A5C7I5L3_9ROSI|nr:hypothetical protein EZV62_011388 [Acer yangbiense]
MRASLSLLRSVSFSLRHQCHLLPRSHPTTKPHRFSSIPLESSSAASDSTSVEHSASRVSSSEEERCDYFNINEKSGNCKGVSLGMEVGTAGSETRHLGSLSLEVKEQWRRSKLAWLCKEFPALKAYRVVYILDAARKWLRQEDATYLVVHLMWIGNYWAAYLVYRWMKDQNWYRFDFDLATKLADSAGKERNFGKCRQMYYEIINQGRYQPHLNLHNSLFRVLTSKPGSSSKLYLKQAELIFHNLVTSGLEIQKDIYVGLIWLHSYQDTVDKERIASLREEMRQVGIEEGKEVLLSVLRVHSKEGNVEEVERICLKLLDSNDGIPTQAFVYKMVAYAKIGEFMKSLDTFREMRKLMGSATVLEYRELIEVLCKAENTKLAESVMDEFVKRGMKPPLIMPCYINITNLNLGMPDRLHLAFFEYENILVYNIYLESLIKAGNVEKADEVFNRMQSDEAIGIDARSCNTILSGYLSSCNTISSGYLASEKYNKVDELFDLMVGGRS